MRRLPAQLVPDLLEWYDHQGRDLPWRARAQEGRQVLADPYLVWLSEIMLQQTTVAAVRSYFQNFVQKWPNVAALAQAEDEKVMAAWAGLGYYARARNLLKCARAIVKNHKGAFPNKAAELQKLPGIGPYTAAAIASIAFGEAAAVVDGNIERVITRLMALRTPAPAAKQKAGAALEPIVPAARPGDFAQALMDLGALVCTPRRPACVLCPLKACCQALLKGEPEDYPLKPMKKQKPTRVGAAFVALRPDGAVLLQKRQAKGLLGGMSEVPGTGWSARQDGATQVTAAPFDAEWIEAGEVRHTFTHFHLELKVYKATVEEPHASFKSGWWADLNALDGEALPGLMRKVIAKALRP